MKNINITISDLEYEQLGLNSDRLSFTEFVDIINKELAKQALKKSIQLAERYGLSGISMDEITKEVKKSRKNAKNNT